MSVIFDPLSGQLLLIPSLTFPGTLVIASGKTFTVNNTLTLAGTDSTTMTFPTTSATLARTDAGQTFTGVQVMTSPTINTSLVFGSGQSFLDNAADVTALSRGANPQTLRLGNTITTPSTAGEWWQEWWASNVFWMGATKGSSSGTARVAKWAYGGTEASPVAAITVPITSGVIVFGGGITAGSSNAFTVANNGIVTVNGGLLLDNSTSISALGTQSLYLQYGAGGNVNICDGAGANVIFGFITATKVLQMGGTTSSFPALKRSSAALQVRLADDSAFAAIQGKITTDNAAVTGLTPGALAALTTATIVIYDSTGQAYRVPCVI